ncbi:hypothetical protein B0H15DRAFT_436124 [Mycena belliarum]|uniref:Uncharacterized protein n=1 Tax=Mycena belliarum TaxID=1033014 RepID=A0AAD6TYD3_9AGAR|nr:hypothetical protein B0H15DRAFT_436124 [Mycena belliae]
MVVGGIYARRDGKGCMRKMREGQCTKDATGNIQWRRSASAGRQVGEGTTQAGGPSGFEGERAWILKDPRGHETEDTTEGGLPRALRAPSHGAHPAAHEHAQHHRADADPDEQHVRRQRGDRVRAHLFLPLRLRSRELRRCDQRDQAPRVELLHQRQRQRRGRTLGRRCTLGRSRRAATRGRYAIGSSGSSILHTPHSSLHLLQPRPKRIHRASQRPVLLRPPPPTLPPPRLRLCYLRGALRLFVLVVCALTVRLPVPGSAGAFAVRRRRRGTPDGAPR